MLGCSGRIDCVSGCFSSFFSVIAVELAKVLLWVTYQGEYLFYNITFTYSMAQQPMKCFDRPLMRASLSNSIVVTLIFY